MSFQYKAQTLLLLLAFSFLFSCTNTVTPDPQITSHNPDTLSVKKSDTTLFLYGIPSDSFNLISGRIKPNQLLSTLLIKYGVTMKEIDIIVKNSSSVFDVRKIKSGNSYTLLCDNDTTGRARYLIYEHDPSTCYIFSFNDSLNITPYYKEIISEIKYASGIIETSLWETMTNGGLHPSLAIQLSEIYAWTVDFFGLQKGDSFKVIYEEMFIDDKSLGTDKIYGAQFTWAGTAISAIPFIQDGKESYYDIEGNSLRKAFLKAPLQFSRISSRFSYSRLHPILRIRRPHYGVDYAAPVGTPVHSVGDGRVISATTENGAGRMVRIQHNSVYSTAYLHLSRFGAGITAGAYVKQSDVIGYVGSTGLSTGPHLDFRFYKNGSPVDPLKVEAPPVEPVSEENKERFEKIKIAVLSLLDTF